MFRTFVLKIYELKNVGQCFFCDEKNGLVSNTKNEHFDGAFRLQIVGKKKSFKQLQTIATLH